MTSDEWSCRYVRLSFEGKIARKKSYVIHTCVSYHIYICEYFTYVYFSKTLHPTWKIMDMSQPSKEKSWKRRNPKKKQFKVHCKPAGILQKHPPYTSWGVGVRIATRIKRPVKRKNKTITQSSLTIQSNHQQAMCVSDVFQKKIAHQFSGPFFWGEPSKDLVQGQEDWCGLFHQRGFRVDQEVRVASHGTFHEAEKNRWRFLALRGNPHETCLNKIQ